MKKNGNFGEKLKRATQPADKVRKAETLYRPPGNRKRKAGAATIWIIIVSMFLLSLLSYITVLGSQNEEEVKEVENTASGPESIEFAKLFASTYFTWDAEGESLTNRSEKLEPMMAEGLDNHAGLVIGTIEWDSRLQSARVVEVEEIGADKALITLAVTQNLTKEDEKVTKEMLFTVPVGFANAYGVYDLPSFAAIDTATEVSGAQLTGTPLDTGVEQNVKAFLDTFFQSYTTDTIDKLSYFLEDPENNRGLESTLSFVEVRQSTVLEESPTVYNVDAEVVFMEESTQIQYVASYRIQVTEKNGRYVVTQLKGGL